MVGLGAFFAAGAVKGFGDSLIEQAQQRREDALIALQQQREDELYNRRRGDQLADRNDERSYQERLAADERQREAGKIDRSATALRKTSVGGRQADFVSSIMPHAERVGREIGVDPRIIVAQAALESGWGRSAPGNNFFGIKSHGRAGGNTLATNEVVDGETVRISDSFRAYGSLAESVDDYGRFLLENPRYREMLSSDDIDAQIAALGRSGYATDPEYANKIRSIVDSIDKMDADTWRVVADPATPAPVRSAVMQGIGLGGSDEKREMKEDSRGVLRYVDTGAPVFENDEPNPVDEYGRYVQEERSAGREPLSRIDYAQAKKGSETIFAPDGNPIVVRGNSSASTKFTEGQSKDNVYATRAEGALRVLEPVADVLTSRSDQVLDAIPLGIGREAQREDFQVAQQAGEEFLQAILRKDTGAAITEQEQFLYGRTFLPQPGDGPAVLEAKRASRQRAIEAIKSGMSPAQIIAQERALKNADNRTEAISTPAPRGDGIQPVPQVTSPRDISNMTLNQLNQVDIMQITDPRILDEMERRHKELTGG